ncbi:porin family protein [uncultured Chitinophaga sp.]|jgi:hypothetical protein|uniref:porin family protein n=1 Tax=uncultured Chitinophaga sp. TaxID=339340 RepID=UPI002631E5E7|nr:porin family protein [uncultured Chitinophaga sp.]
MTNRLLLIITGCLLLTTAAYSQSFHFGLKADLSFNSLHGNGLAGTFKPAFNAGAFGELNISSKWAIQPELLFTLYNNKAGADFTKYYVNSGASGANNSKIQLGYLSIPVLLTYNVNEFLSLNLGPQYNLLVSYDETLLQNGRRAIKKNDLGAAAGLTLHVSQVRFYGRYVMGLSDLNDIDNRYSWKTHQIQLGLGIAIK